MLDGINYRCRWRFQRKKPLQPRQTLDSLVAVAALVSFQNFMKIRCELISFGISPGRNKFLLLRKGPESNLVNFVINQYTYRLLLLSAISNLKTQHQHTSQSDIISFFSSVSFLILFSSRGRNLFRVLSFRVEVEMLKIELFESRADAFPVHAQPRWALIVIYPPPKTTTFFSFGVRSVHRSLFIAAAFLRYHLCL